MNGANMQFAADGVCPAFKFLSSAASRRRFLRSMRGSIFLSRIDNRRKMDSRVREDDIEDGSPPRVNASTGAAFRAKVAGKARQCVSFILSIVLFAIGSAHAQTPTPEMPPMKPELELRLKKLETELRCLVCQNQTLAESPAGLAGDLRREVRILAESGKSDVEIKSHLKARYGDFVLYKPELDTKTWLLWFGPFVLLAGGALLVVMINRRLRAVTVAAPSLDEKDRARARKLFGDDK